MFNLRTSWIFQIRLLVNRKVESYNVIIRVRLNSSVADLIAQVW